MRFYPYLLAISCLAFSCNKPQAETSSESAQEQAIIEVDTIVLRKQTFQKQLVCNGKLVAIRKAELMCPNAGDVLQEVYVKNGQRVAKGTLLALSDTHIKSENLERANHDRERSKIELQDKLIGLGYDGKEENVPADVLHRAEITSGYFSAQHDVKMAKASLNDCRLTAPFSGRIANLQAKAHQKGNVFGTLIDDSAFDVEFKVLEVELASLRLGTTVMVSPFVHDGEPMQGSVTEINPLVDDKGLVTIKARIRNKSGQLLDGMNVRIIIENSVADQLIVPKEAVVERDGYHVVFIYNPETRHAEWRYVDIAYSNMKHFALTGCAKKETDLGSGEIVIVSGNLNLADETEVTIRQE